nr:hypothetical protein CFP56_60258 [Quercus suber]
MSVKTGELRFLHSEPSPDDVDLYYEGQRMRCISLQQCDSTKQAGHKGLVWKTGIECLCFRKMICAVNIASLARATNERQHDVDGENLV